MAQEQEISVIEAQPPKYNLTEEQERKEIFRQYRSLLRSLRSNLKSGDKELVREAFEMAADAHKTMRRKSGEPYIFHPLAVARICTEEIGLGIRSTICALLHDTVEDTDITLEDIEREFGTEIAKIVDGLTKISNVIDPHTSAQAENFKKILLTLTDDPRVILIKLADRLHNMRTLDYMKREKQLKIASETVWVYAPLAHRMGLYNIKTEMEDLSMKYLEPEAYKDIARKLADTRRERSRYINEFIKPLKEKLTALGFDFDIYGRPKSIHSIWNKIKKKGVAFEKNDSHPNSSASPLNAWRLAAKNRYSGCLSRCSSANMNFCSRSSMASLLAPRSNTSNVQEFIRYLLFLFARAHSMGQFAE